jgi:hypothetical protein
MPHTIDSGWRGWCWVLWAVSVLPTVGYALPVEARQPHPVYTLLPAACNPLFAEVETLWHWQDYEASMLCADAHASIATASRVATSQEVSVEQMPSLEWKTVHETEKLRPIAGVSAGIASFGTFDGDVTLNLPLIGTTLLSSRTGFLDFGAMVGVGLGGFYVHLGIEFPLYYKYPNFWSLDFTVGTAYNLGFFLEPAWESTGFWRGGPTVNLELGLFRISTVVAVGMAGEYCATSFLCEASPGAYIGLGIALIESTTGLPSQRE